MREPFYCSDSADISMTLFLIKAEIFCAKKICHIYPSISTFFTNILLHILHLKGIERRDVLSLGKKVFSSHYAILSVLSIVMLENT